MKPARIPAVAVAAALLQSGVAWPQMIQASTGTAALTGLGHDTLEAIAASSAAALGLPPDASPGARPKAPDLPPGVTALVESLNTDPIDFNFRDADLLGILRSFAIRFGRNIIAAPGVGGKVNIQLRGVPFDEAFRLLLGQMGLVAIQKSAGVIEVIKAADMPVLAQVFPLKYRFANEVQATLLSVLDKKEHENTVISVDIGSNSLIVTSTNDTLLKMKMMIGQMDIPSPQIAIKARLIEVENINNLSWGINWAASAPFGSGGRTRSIKDQSNYTVNPDGSINTNNAPVNFPSGGILDISSVMNKTQLYFMLNFLKADTKSKTLSEPMVLTGNNKVAKIHVGKNIPVVTSQVTQTATTQSVGYIPEGVDLEVTPIVSPGSSVISFKVRINVSELVGFQLNNPITTERVATTEVSVESGMTIVIGGLIKDSFSDSETGIPILKDIPVLGWLFKNKTKNKDRTELLIFITPELQPRTA